jgi:hypothetical protein
MATLYFSGYFDSTWDTLLNWFLDKDFTLPATTIPTNGDTVYIEGAIFTGPTTAVTLAALYIAQAATYDIQFQDTGAGISTTGDLILGSK